MIKPTIIDRLKHHAAEIDADRDAGEPGNLEHGILMREAASVIEGLEARVARRENVDHTSRTILTRMQDMADAGLNGHIDAREILSEAAEHIEAQAARIVELEQQVAIARDRGAFLPLPSPKTLVARIRAHVTAMAVLKAPNEQAAQALAVMANLLREAAVELVGKDGQIDALRVANETLQGAMGMWAPEPGATSPLRYYSRTPSEQGEACTVQVYRLPETARAEAAAVLEDGSEGWPEDVAAVEWGMLVPFERAAEHNRKETPGEEFDWTCEYKLVPSHGAELRARLEAAHGLPPVETVSPALRERVEAEVLQPQCTGEVHPTELGAVETTFTEVFYISGLRTALRFEGLADIYLSDADAQKLAALVVAGGEPAPTAKKGRLPEGIAGRLVDAYEPLCLILDVMEAAKTRGWPRGFVMMETDEGDLGQLTTKGGLSDWMARDMQETLDKRLDDGETEHQRIVRGLVAEIERLEADRDRDLAARKKAFEAISSEVPVDQREADIALSAEVENGRLALLVSEAGALMFCGEREPVHIAGKAMLGLFRSLDREDLLSDIDEALPGLIADIAEVVEPDDGEDDGE